MPYQIAILCCPASPTLPSYRVFGNFPGWRASWFVVTDDAARCEYVKGSFVYTDEQSVMSSEKLFDASKGVLPRVRVTGFRPAHEPHAERGRAGPDGERGPPHR